MNNAFLQTLEKRIDSMCRFLQAEESKEPQFHSEKVEGEREDPPFDSEDFEGEPWFDFITIARKLQGMESMTEYKVSLLSMNEEPDYGDLPLIHEIIGNELARMFYDKAKKTCVMLCVQGAYYCDYKEESVEAFTRCWHKGIITIQQVSLQGDSILLTSMEDQKKYHDLKILFLKKYR